MGEQLGLFLGMTLAAIAGKLILDEGWTWKTVAGSLLLSIAWLFALL